MKNFCSHLLLLTPLLGLVSCGSQSAGGKLEISQSFATTNTSFGGGLVISGKHIASGKTFSQSLLGGKEMRINLEQGEWKISAVGWDGGGTPGNEKPFAGNPFCGSVTANLVNSSTIIDLNINQANCNTFEFSAGHTDGGGVLRSFDTIVTCNTFFQAAINVNNPISGQYIADGSITDGFCGFPALSNDLKSNVKAVKIYSNNKLPGQQFPQLGINTGCLRGNNGNTSLIKLSSPTGPTNSYAGYTVKFPFNNLPLTIVTFEDLACDEPLATFQFKNGLAAGSNDFDHLLHERTGSEMKLLLPANDLKRAKSALIGLLPSIKKDVAGIPTKFATTPSNLGSLNYPAIMNTHHKVILNRDDCGSSAPTTSGPVSVISCLDLGNRIELNYKGGVSPAAASITISTTPPLTLSLNVITNSSLEAIKYKSQSKVIELLGQDVENQSIYFEQNEDNKQYGVLSNIRHMFSPDGAGGVLGLGLGNIIASTTFVQACNNLSLNKVETIYNEDEMQFESYRVNIHNAFTSSPTNYMCETLNNSSTCSSGLTYDKRMTIFDHKQSLIEPLYVLEFNCEKLVGRFESKEIKVDGLSRTTKKQIVSWNTDPDTDLSNQRLEQMSINARDKNISGSWVRVAENRDMARLQKINLDNFAAWSYHFQTVFDGTNHKQEAQALFLETVNNGNDLFFSHWFVQDSDSIDRFSVFSTLSPNLTNAPVISAADRFLMGGNYPQPHVSPAITYTLRPTGNSSDEIDGRIPFQLIQLNSIDFTGSFGTTFYSAP